MAKHKLIYQYSSVCLWRSKGSSLRALVTFARYSVLQEKKVSIDTQLGIVFYGHWEGRLDQLQLRFRCRGRHFERMTKALYPPSLRVYNRLSCMRCVESSEGVAVKIIIAVTLCGTDGLSTRHKRRAAP
jgi:hypothetical protein